jgi:hypothetical protein
MHTLIWEGLLNLFRRSPALSFRGFFHHSEKDRMSQMAGAGPSSEPHFAGQLRPDPLGRRQSGRLFIEWTRFLHEKEESHE